MESRGHQLTAKRLDGRKAYTEHSVLSGDKKLGGCWLPLGLLF
jgi:hypothetical protein